MNHAQVLGGLAWKAVAAILAALIVLSLGGTPATADQAVAAGQVGASFENASVKLDAVCTYAADLPDNDPDRNPIAFSARATTTPRTNLPLGLPESWSPTNEKTPFATGVNCFVRAVGGVGSAGLSMVGPVVATAGQGSFPRTALVELCVVGSVLYTDGTSDDTRDENGNPTCRSL